MHLTRFAVSCKTQREGCTYCMEFSVSCSTQMPRRKSSTTQFCSPARAIVPEAADRCWLAPLEMVCHPASARPRGTKLLKWQVRLVVTLFDSSRSECASLDSLRRQPSCRVAGILHKMASLWYALRKSRKTSLACPYDRYGGMALPRSLHGMLRCLLRNLINAIISRQAMQPTSMNRIVPHVYNRSDTKRRFVA
jgi:hypothetical protein